MSAVTNLARVGSVLGGGAIGAVLTAAAGDIPASTIVVISTLAAGAVAVAAYITWLDSRIDTRITLRLAPLSDKVEALYNHFIAKANKE